MRSICLGLFLLLIITSASLAAPPQVDSYRLDVTFTPDKAAIAGMAAMTFEPETSLPAKLTFYLHGELEVDSIKQSGSLLEYRQEKVFYECDYSYVANKTDMTLLSSAPGDTIAVYYHGHLNPSRARAQSNYMRVDDDGVFLRSLGYSVWFPVLLDSWKDSYATDFVDVTIRTPEEFLTVFVGRHMGDSIAEGTRVSRWQALNTSLFDAQCSSQRCSKLSVDAVNVYYWNDPTSTAIAEKIADFVNLMTTRFAESYRSDASVEEYHIVQMPEYGDISSGNMSGLQVEYWHSFERETWARRGLAHEIIHPFVRLKVDKHDPLYAFAIESFPSFFHLPILQEVLGDEWYEKYMKQKEDRYLKYKTEGKDRRGNDLPVEKPIDQITGNEIGTYKDYFILSDRALLFLNYVREKMGHKPFAEFSRDFFNQQTFDNESFRKIIAEHLGDAREDVDIWLSTNDYPERFRLGNL